MEECLKINFWNIFKEINFHEKKKHFQLFPMFFEELWVICEINIGIFVLKFKQKCY